MSLYAGSEISIIRNSCLKCNRFYNYMVDGEFPWMSTCHEFQCRKQNPRNVRKTEYGIAFDDEEEEDSVLNESQSPLSTNGHIDQLPPEILTMIFDWLDGYSLLCAGSVSPKWRDLVVRMCTMAKNDHKVFERTLDLFLPQQFRQLYTLMDGQVFSSLLSSFNCNSCFLLDLDPIPIDSEKFPSSAAKRVYKEMRELPCEGVHAISIQDRVDKLIGRIEGPKDSPYENGIFYLMVECHKSVPFDATKIRFLTKIFHPAVSCHGHISVDILEYNWCPAMTLSKILLSIQSLLADKNFELCSRNTPVGKLFKENKPQFERIARIWTQKYAMQHLIHPSPPPILLPALPPQNNV